MSELKIFLLLTGNNIKDEYISSDQVEKYEVEVCINNQAVSEKKHVVRDCTGLQEKKNIFI